MTNKLITDWLYWYYSTQEYTKIYTFDRVEFTSVNDNNGFIRVYKIKLINLNTDGHISDYEVEKCLDISILELLTFIYDQATTT